MTDEQVRKVERMASEPTRACLDGSTLGSGKTLTSVELARSLGAATVLVIAPKNTRAGWERTVRAQEIGLNFKVIDSSKEGIANHAALTTGEPGFYFIGREFFHLSATSATNREARWSWKKTKPDLVVLDESHSVAANRWSNGYKVLKTLDAGYKLALSATPQGNKFTGIWPVCRWLWGNRVNPATNELYVDKSQYVWIARWAETTYDHFAYNKSKVVGEKNPGAFVASLPCYVRMERREVPRKTYRVNVDMTTVQREQYDKMMRQALIWIDEQPLLAEIPVVQRTRMRQISLAEIDLSDEFEVVFPQDAQSSKIKAAEKIMGWHPGEPILFLTDSAKFARLAAERLGGTAWTGETKKAERDKILSTFGAPGGAQYLFATLPSIGEGVDGLQAHCNIEVWFNRSDNGILNEQASGRLNRTGQEADVIHSYDIVCRDSADDGHLDKMLRAAVDRKKEVSLCST